MRIQIIPAVETDLPEIFSLFDAAIRFQEVNHYTGWKQYDENFVRKDLAGGELIKIINDDLKIMCIFSVCYSDELIWTEKEKGDSLYLHRIILNRQFAGLKIFNRVLSWSVGHAREKGLNYIRMDTWAENEKLITYYQSYGFRVTDHYTTPNSDALPVQNRNLKVALLEYALPEHLREAVI